MRELGVHRVFWTLDVGFIYMYYIHTGKTPGNSKLSAWSGFGFDFRLFLGRLGKETTYYLQYASSASALCVGLYALANWDFSFIIIYSRPYSSLFYVKFAADKMKVNRKYLCLHIRSYRCCVKVCLREIQGSSSCEMYITFIYILYPSFFQLLSKCCGKKDYRSIGFKYQYFK